jgi:Ni2+-binding GTPase involved in maturation of urease and hydrogenase
MRLHLVGGFLGSGKTTAIIQASRILLEKGLKVGVVTNDQGRYLVDTAFMRLSELPTVEVTGGCFCCNYSDLDSSLDQLLVSAKPEVIFAESVGSCADLVATVVKPLLQLKQVESTPTSFTVFADGRLLRRRLRGDPMPFSEDVVYIYDKQLEEAGLIVINKVDLLTGAGVEETYNLLHTRYPEKTVIPQISLTPDGVSHWLTLLEDGSGLLPDTSLNINYERYGRGEAQLAWLDEEIIFEGAETAQWLRRLLSGVIDGLRSSRKAIGHLKFFIQAGDLETKLSFTTLEDPDWDSSLPALSGGKIRLLVNARVEMPAQDLRDLFRNELNKAGGVYLEGGVSYFHPRQPTPTHRIQ